MASPSGGNTLPIQTLVGAEILSLAAFVAAYELRASDVALCVVALWCSPTETPPRPWRRSGPLAHHGITARLVQNADFGLIEQQIARGIPGPCGTLHRGPVHRPGGGGHWLIVISHEPRHVIVHDPWGEPDLLSGATLNGNGRQLRFSRENYRCAGLRLRPPLDGGADRWRRLPPCAGEGLGDRR